MSAIKNEAVDWFNEHIKELHELAFSVIEEKNKGVTDVPIDDYEKLLNWTIEVMQGLRDDVDEHGDDLVPRSTLGAIGPALGQFNNEE